jgi:hypothetical protein
MSYTTSPGRDAQESAISRDECRAIRALDHDDGYTRSEIAFMMECQVPTVARHADGECHHDRWAESTAASQPIQYSVETLREAYLRVLERVPGDIMSARRYDEFRDDDDPSRGAFASRFGSWPEARQFVRGGRDE